jgi:hypothetical protein
MLSRNSFPLLILLGFMLNLPIRATAQQETPFRGRALQSSGVVSCFADRAAVTGYYRTPVPAPGKPEVVLRSTPIESQTAGGGYKISFAGEHALVRDEFMKESYQFQVHARRESGIVLVRGKGVGVEIITIDPQNGSFVHTDAGVQPLWNRANVWVGRCE